MVVERSMMLLSCRRRTSLHHDINHTTTRRVFASFHFSHVPRHFEVYWPTGRYVSFAKASSNLHYSMKSASHRSCSFHWMYSIRPLSSGSKMYPGMPFIIELFFKKILSNQAGKRKEYLSNASFKSLSKVQGTSAFLPEAINLANG